MAFRSILFDDSATPAAPAEAAPDYFTDLNLDQVVTWITAGRAEYNLQPYFYTPQSGVATIEYRHAILKDLQDEALRRYVASFARKMHSMRAALAQAVKLHYKYQRERWFLDVVATYCDAVTGLGLDLARADLRSAGFVAFRAYVADYTASEAFTSLVEDTRKLTDDLAAIRYLMHIQGNRVEVRRYDSEPDYGAAVEDVFDKFKQGAPRNYDFGFPSSPDMNHVEAAVLQLVSRLYPETFAELDEYAVRHRAYLDRTIGTFDREVQFYVAYLEYVAGLERSGLRFCLPDVTRRSRDVFGRDTFDLALAHTLVQANKPVVSNDFYLADPERVAVVSGPNQGGKTTFARTFGQLHYLAALGLPVPGSEARLFLFDHLFTHFERAEDLENLSGKLEDDLVRIHAILQRATPDSILIMNESFNSATASDALLLSREILQQVIRSGMLCVTVTFLDELASMDRATVSLVSTIDPQDPSVRTFEVVRRAADGLAYAAAIAAKYGLTYPRVKARIVS